MLKTTLTRQSRLAEIMNPETLSPWKLVRRFDRDFIKAYRPFPHGYIADVLKPWVAQDMLPGAGCAIFAQTGTGKSTFLLDSLIPVAESYGAEVMYFTFRSAVALQTKRRIAEKFTPEILEDVTDSGLQKLRQIGPCRVHTIHELSSRKVRTELINCVEKIRFLVIDEVHLAVSDATFNGMTEDVLRFLIMQLGRNCARVYMTATPQLILDPLIALEKELDSKMPPRKYRQRAALPVPDFKKNCYYADVAAGEEFTIYPFLANYSYLSLVFFQRKESLIEHLMKHDTTKTLIFVSSLEEGEQLCQKLGSENAEFISATSKNSLKSDEYATLIKSHTFTKKFLIVTRWLDCGVDLCDLEFKTIVSDTIWEEEVLQMVGRKRILSQADALTVYLWTPSKNHISRLLRTLETKIDEICEFQTRTGSCDLCKLPEYAFAKLLPNQMYSINVNSFALHQLKSHATTLREYLTWFEESEEEAEERLAAEIHSWFPGAAPYRWLDRKAPNLTTLIELLDQTAGKDLDKNDAIDFSNAFCLLAGIPRRKAQQGQIATTTINKYLQERKLPYSLTNLSSAGRKAVWNIKKG